MDRNTKSTEQQISEIQYIIDKNPKCKYSWKISHARLDDKDWTTVQEISNQGNFTTRIEEILDQFGTDAIRVELHKDVGLKKPKHSQTIDIRLTDAFIHVLDEEKEKEKQKEKEKAKESAKEEKEIDRNQLDGLVEEAIRKREAQLSGDISSKFNEFEKQLLREKFESKIQFMEQGHKHELVMLREKLDALAKENTKLEKELGDADLLLADLENKLAQKEGSKNKLLELGMMGVMGKQLGFDKKDMMNLAGMMMGADSPALEPHQETSGSTAETLSPQQQQRLTDMAKIYHWMQMLDEPNFRKFAQLVLSIDKEPGLLDDFLELLGESDGRG